MARRVEVSFYNPSIATNMECCLYNLPNNDLIGNANFEEIYKMATYSQRKKLDKLQNDRNLEIVINLNVADLKNANNNNTQQKIYKYKGK